MTSSSAHLKWQEGSQHMVSVIFSGVLAPKGGPSGYLYNLQKSIDESGVDSIHILTPPAHGQNASSSHATFWQRHLIVPDLLKLKRQIGLYKSLLTQHQKTIAASRILHFHTTMDMYAFAKLYDISKHHVVLMSHSPTLSHIENYEAALAAGYSKLKALDIKRFKKKADTFAFSHADTILFPCEGADESYQEFFAKHKIANTKIKYLLTSTMPLVPKMGREDFRRTHQIPLDALVAGYVGRKSHIKGYDLFCGAACEMSANRRFFFIAAGVGDIASPRQENFWDLGWSDDPASIISACDVVAVPNRQTYFDLGIIQALSLDKQIITTKTGGNRWFEGRCEGVHLLEPNESMQEFLQRCDLSQKPRTKELYDAYFANDGFAARYDAFYRGLVEQ